MTSPTSRVAVTDAAAALLRQLTAQHGKLMFHQSGGCCDGSSPMCYPDGDFVVGDRDVLLLVAHAELTYAEVAQALDPPVGTVRSRLNRARRIVRAALDDTRGTHRDH